MAGLKEEMGPPGALAGADAATLASGLALPSGRLLHYGKAPLATVLDEAQPEELWRSTKPNGLWVSVEGEDDWLSWCMAESFALDRITHATEISLATDANVLVLNTAEAVEAFTDEWGIEKRLGSFTDRAINWPALAAHYDGIIIAPYQWSLRLASKTGWYYGWDCASGCLWNARAIGKLTPVVPPDLDALREEAA